MKSLKPRMWSECRCSHSWGCDRAQAWSREELPLRRHLLRALTSAKGKEKTPLLFKSFHKFDVNSHLFCAGGSPTPGVGFGLWLAHPSCPGEANVSPFGPTPARGQWEALCPGRKVGEMGARLKGRTPAMHRLWAGPHGIQGA